MRKPLIYKHFEGGILSLTNGLNHLLRHRYGLWILGALSFIESTLLIPLITDPFMVAYILAHPTKAFAAVAMTTLASVFGGFIAYITAAFFMNLILGYLSPESVTQFNDLVEHFQNGTFLLAFIGAVTPVPFTLTALVAGTVKGNLLIFLFGSLVGRILRYGLVGYLTYTFGETAILLGKKYLGLFTIFTIISVSLYLWLIL